MPGDCPTVQLLLPPRFWDTPGDVPSYRLWTTQFENYMFSIDSQRPADKKLSDEFKSHLAAADKQLAAGD